MKNAAVMVFVLIFVLLSLHSFSDASTAVITEVKRGQGTVEIKRHDGKEWSPVQPLQSLTHDDAIRASGDSYAVILYSTGEGIIKVTSGNSPYEVKSGKPKEDKIQKAQSALLAVAEFLSGRKQNVLSIPLAVRGLMTRPPALISPKDTKILSLNPYFLWIGSPRVPYTVRLKQGDNVIWTKEKAYKTQIMYPKTEQALRSGVRYQWEIKTDGYPGVRAFFEIASDEEKKKVLDELSLLDTPEYKAVSISTIAVLKYGILISRGFSAEARNILFEAISADPDDPGLHMLMGDYYGGIGLKDLAAEEYDEAGFLMSVNQ